MTRLVTNNFKLNLADQVVESLTEPANTALYIFAGEHVERANTDIPTPTDSPATVLYDTYRNMIFGKRLSANDVSVMIRRVDYEVNKAFDKYDDEDTTLYTKDFYTISDEGAFYHVYKVLDNNLGANSTVEPQVAFVSGANNYVFETADGYKWKYMYSVSDADELYLATDMYFPVVPNTTIEDNAVKGAIDDITIDGQGRGYGNYLTSTFTAGDVRIGGNSSLYQISNTNINLSNGFYTGCMLYLSSGTGSGQYSLISDYFSNPNGNFAVIETVFAVPPVNGTEYEITPSITIVGSGSQTEDAVARALVNANASNAVYKVEMLNVGSDYDYAVANVIANVVVNVAANAIVRPINAPFKGHGANSSAELGSHALICTTKFTNSESNTIAANNEYQQIGILKDPIFANVNIELKNSIGTFLGEELLFKVDPIRVQTNAVVNTTSAVIQSETSELTGVVVVEGGSSGSYIPGEILTVANGTPILNATMNVTSTEVRTVAINTPGSGYSNGDTVEVDDGTSTTNAEFTVTTGAADTIPASLVISGRGDYTANPTLTDSATTATSGSGTNLTVDLTMRVLTAAVKEAGAYAIVPDTYANNFPSGGSGTGAEMSLTFSTTGLGDFLNQFVVGEYIFIRNIEDTSHQLAVVNSITNATYMDITVNGYFSCAQAYVCQSNITSNAVISDVANATHILVDSVQGVFATDDEIIGFASGAKAQVNTIARNDVVKTFDTFNQLYKYDVTVISGSFVEDEKVYQGASLATSTANATVHSLVVDGGSTLLYTSNQVGLFSDVSTVIGEGGATASINQQYDPEVEFGSGQVLFLENIEPVTRDDAQSEQFKIFIEF